MVFVFFNNGNETQEIPANRRQFFEECRRHMSDEDYRKAYEWINSEINALISKTPAGNKPVFNSRVMVSKKRFPPHGNWEPPCLSVYEAAGQNEERAKGFYDLICWKAVIDREERWLGYQDDSLHLLGMTCFRSNPKSDNE